MAAAAVSPSQTQSRVYSASYIKDGQVICACDKPAVRFISKTPRNPGRAFYCCETKQCKFWKWEDEIPPDLLNSLEKQNPQSSSGAATGPMTPKKVMSSTYPLSPPETQAPPKRTFTTMQDGAGSGAGMGRRPSDIWSAEAKARRIANIVAAQRGENVEEDILETQREVKEESQEGRYMLKSPPPRSGSYVRPSTIPLDSDGIDGEQQQEEEEEESILRRRATKRPRFGSFQLQLPSTRTISQSYQLPTPNTSEREVSEAMFMHEGTDTVPPSPTSFTKAGQRAAIERERTSINGRADEPDLFTSTRSSSSVGARPSNHSKQASGSFAAQLGSVIANAHGNSDAPRAASQRSQRSQSQSSTALAQATSDDFPSLLMNLQARWEKTRSEKEEWQRRAIDAERKVTSLEKENNEWKQKFSRLEELFGKVMAPSPPNPTPPRRSN